MCFFTWERKNLFFCCFVLYDCVFSRTQKSASRMLIECSKNLYLQKSRHWVSFFFWWLFLAFFNQKGSQTCHSFRIIIQSVFQIFQCQRKFQNYQKNVSKVLSNTTLCKILHLHNDPVGFLDSFCFHCHYKWNNINRSEDFFTIPLIRYKKFCWDIAFF